MHALIVNFLMVPLAYMGPKPAGLCPFQLQLLSFAATRDLWHGFCRFKLLLPNTHLSPPPPTTMMATSASLVRRSITSRCFLYRRNSTQVDRNPNTSCFGPIFFFSGRKKCLSVLPEDDRLVWSKKIDFGKKENSIPRKSLS